MRHWQFTLVGKDREGEPSGPRTTVVGAETEEEATEIIEEIEKQMADHFGDKPWKIDNVTETEWDHRADDA